MESFVDRLPDDVLLVAFSMLNGKDLATVSQVNRKWNRISYLEDGYLWRTVYEAQFPRSPYVRFQSPLLPSEVFASNGLRSTPLPLLAPVSNDSHTVLHIAPQHAAAPSTSVSQVTPVRTFQSWRQLFQHDYTRQSWKELATQRQRQLRKDSDDWFCPCADRNLYKLMILSGIASFLIVNLLLFLHEQHYINGIEMLVVIALWALFCIAIVAMVRCRWVTNWTRALVYSGWLSTVVCLVLATLRFQFAVQVPVSLFYVAVVSMGITGCFMLVSVCACLQLNLVPAAYRGPWSCFIDGS